jgi:hypothetical protein
MMSGLGDGQPTAPEGDGYAGEAELTIRGSRFTVKAQLRGYVEPTDGRYHWYGRLDRHDGLTACLSAGRAEGVLTTPHGSARCNVADADPWRRFRVTGLGSPPFPSDLRLTHRATRATGTSAGPRE